MTEPDPHSPALTFNPSPRDLQALHAAWGWRLGSAWRPLMCTVLGDLFLQLASGHVWWLSTGTGDLCQVADSAPQFRAALAGQAGDEWLLPGLVEALARTGKALAPGQCYTFSTFPVFAAGSYSVENMFPVEAHAHFAMSGWIHKRICHLPDGATVDLAIPL